MAAGALGVLFAAGLGLVVWRRRVRKALLGSLLAVSLVGCGGRGGEEVEAAESPLEPGPPVLACFGNELLFGRDDLDAPATAEQGAGPEAEGLRAVLGGGEELGGYPARGWRELARTEAEVLFATGEPPEDLLGLVLERRGEAWVFRSSGGCVPEVVRDGLARAEWRLAAGAPAPGPASEVVEVEVTERACAGGQSSEARVVGPEVAYGVDAVVVTFFVEPLPPGDVTCQGNPSSLRSVRLSESLGDRSLLDGGVYPPTAPSTEG